MALKRAREHFPNDSVEVDDVNSFISTKIALSFDHILEEIFTSLNLEDLLNCRLVCHRWLNFAHKPLQKQIKLTFCENEQTDKNGYRRTDVLCKRLSELTILLKKGLSLWGNIPNQFPCNRFELKSVSLSNEDLNQFLNTNGHNVQELDLDLDLDTDTDADDFVDEYDLMDEIENLLLNQVPTIRYLRLNIGWIEHIGWINKNKNPRNDFLEKTDPEYEEIRQKASDLLRSKPSPSLKVLHLSGEGFAKILEFIIRISPNLEEVKLCDNTNYEFWLDNHVHLLEPENRLSLLKQIIFYLDINDLILQSNIKIMEKVSRGNFHLRSFQVLFSDDDDPAKWIQKYAGCLSRIAGMINRIYKGSSDTLERIYLNNVTILRGMKFPDVMPKLREINISESMKINGGDTNQVMTLFPMGSNFQKTFPKLRSIKLLQKQDPNNLRSFSSNRSFSSFLKSLNFGADPLSTIVRRVTLSPGLSELNFSVISQIIQEWFPNALMLQEFLV